ncbi:hypothetical protein [Chryseobacterium vrystaatense]|uniref:Phage integrase SAM-like domain-containing protein n=1 Tax=Chryseobacterium vrystaatense TaxID=307480 RepID=A0ABR4UIM1_9FLAO|nr:hypothetical protein [Chryseobacterium vrystaatense]KFF24458.1 hypothetical protein IW16_19235 [Chryseobacterium vrystaatense]
MTSKKHRKNIKFRWQFISAFRDGEIAGQRFISAMETIEASARFAISKIQKFNTVYHEYRLNQIRNRKALQIRRFRGSI